MVHGWHGGLESLIKVMISLEKRDTLVVYGGEFFKNGTYLLVTTTIKASIVMQKSSFSP